MTSTKTSTKKITRGRPTSEDTAVIEAKLLAAALAEFLQQGYGGASMSNIVKVAGVSKTTLYSRFTSKAALFRAIIFQQIDDLSPSTSLESEHGPLNLKQGLTTYANRTLELSLQGDMLGINRLMYSESHRFPELGVAVAERTGLGIKRISAFILECAAADGIPCKDPEAVAEAFILMVRGWYINTMLTNLNVSAEQRERWVERAVHTLLSAREDW